jgi:DNA mismatch repair protein MutL
VKELVENSIDAGARSIEVGIQRGGMSRIRVVDDGCGMDRDDALLSLERHATSKIASAADLAAISTLGFRGEALPSIASVSRFRLTTREPGAVAGTEILVNGGRIETVRDGGEAPGTQVEVRSLFYNVPARRKFLRSETTETRNIEHQFFLQALAHPAIAFSLVRDEKVALQLPVTTVPNFSMSYWRFLSANTVESGFEAGSGELVSVGKRARNNSFLSTGGQSTAVFSPLRCARVITLLSCADNFRSRSCLSISIRRMWM